MNKSKFISLSIYNQIYKNVITKKWKCLYPNCSQEAINSHLLQVKGILNHITEQNHLIEVRQNDIFLIAKGASEYIFKRTGINNAISKPLFCNYHDTALFKIIESDNVDFGSYKAALLLSYRSVSAELRRKEILLEFESRLLKSNRLKSSIPSDVRQEYEEHCAGFQNGIKDLSFFKKEFEENINNELEQRFYFKSFEYFPIKVCTAAVWSPILPNEQKKVVTQEEPLKTLFLNVIPQENQLYITTGYHKDFVNDWMHDYIDSWQVYDQNNQERQISDLIVTKVDSWAMSPSIYKNMPTYIKKAFLDYWNNNSMNLSTEQKINFNVFQV